MSAAQLIRQARRAEGLSQRALAARAGIRQPALADIERGVHDTRVASLERLLAGTGHHLIAVPTWAPSAADCGEQIFEALPASDGEERAFRALLGFSDGLGAVDGPTKVALCVTPPAPTGDRRFDAALAAVVEYHLAAEKLPIPLWVNEPDRILDDVWVVSPYSGTDVEERTPQPFRRRNIHLAASELASV